MGVSKSCGFAGHALEMAVHSGVRMNVSFSALPLYEGALKMQASGITTGTSEGNRRICGGRLEVKGRIRREQKELLRDLQVAGVSRASLIGHRESGDPAIVVEN